MTLNKIAQVYANTISNNSYKNNDKNLSLYTYIKLKKQNERRCMLKLCK